VAKAIFESIVSGEELLQFEQEGFLVMRGLLADEEVTELLDTFMTMHASGPIEGCFHPLPAEAAGSDILRQFPRMMHPHRVNETAKSYMLHPKVLSVLASLFGEEPLAAQSMLYFKPPGARGQALHQDNFYLKVEPGTCIAAWMALDPADRENGGMVVVPNSSQGDIQCPHLADPALSFTEDEVTVPEGLAPTPIDLAAGDVLFFNGSLIHGSYTNTSDTRFRRAYIGHYVGESTTKLGRFYNPLFAHDGQVLRREDNPDAGPCGGAEISAPIHS